MPDWLKPLIWNAPAPTNHDVEDTVRTLNVKKNYVAVKVRIQTSSAGCDYYNSQEDSHSTYESVFHCLFRTFFSSCCSSISKIIDTNKTKEHSFWSRASTRLLIFVPCLVNAHCDFGLCSVASLELARSNTCHSRDRYSFFIVVLVTTIKSFQTYMPDRQGSNGVRPPKFRLTEPSFH